MAEEFDAAEAELRLRGLAGVMGNTFANPITSDEALPIVNEFADLIAEQLRLKAHHRSVALDRFPPMLAPDALAEDPVGQFGLLQRTLSFTRRTRLGGVPTLVIDDSRQQGRETPRVTVIDVFNREAIARIALDARSTRRAPPNPDVSGDQALAEFLRVALPGHPWARLSEETIVVRDLGTGFSLLMARNMHAAATSGSTTINFTVNTTTSGLVLDVFPELTYAPRRFGAKVSSPVTANLSTGWWKFETLVGGALVRDRGRHLASATSTSTVTGDF